MVDIPLALNAYERTASLLPEVICRNVFIEKDDSDPSNPRVVRIQRPGLKPFMVLPNGIRGLYFSEYTLDNRIYAATGADLVVFENNSYSLVGNIGNDERGVSFAPSFDKIAVASAGGLYTLLRNATTNTTTFGKITMPDNRRVGDVAELNNYIVVACPDGRFYWIAPGENSVQALNFLTAESSNDGLVAVQRVGDELYFFGNQSTEVWAATGDVNIPFQRSPGRNFTRGILGRDTVRIVDNTAFWVADNGVVYRASTTPQRISNHGIEERISKRSGELSALTVTVDAHEFYVLKVPGQGSFAYDAATKLWCEFSTLNRDTWAPGSSIQIDTTAYLADEDTGAIWTLDPGTTSDAGLQIERLVTGTIELPTKPTRNDNFRVDLGADRACNVDVRWKDSQGTWSKWVTLKAKGGNERLAFFRGEAHANDAWKY
ncbi:MAG: hypothetical protein EOO77_16585 [Oxalobacteraceae bacterium]|nr:MAG: hypothetical protein EOO77_16585 [Oxalobacteraceae bacterium]